MQTETLPDAETLDRQLCGEFGLAAQLLAFRGSWSLAHSYMRMIRQTALGCKQACENDNQLSAELDALCLVISDVEGWFARCESGIHVLQMKAEQGAGEIPLVH